MCTPTLAVTLTRTTTVRRHITMTSSTVIGRIPLRLALSMRMTPLSMSR